jgi:hypothetical protein
MTERDERELLVEQVGGAWRPSRIDGGLPAHPAWADLDEAGRVEAYEVALRLRRLEAALDGEGLSATGRAVMDRLART